MSSTTGKILFFVFLCFKNIWSTALVLHIFWKIWAFWIFLLLLPNTLVQLLQILLLWDVLSILIIILQYLICCYRKLLPSLFFILRFKACSELIVELDATQMHLFLTVLVMLTERASTSCCLIVPIQCKIHKVWMDHIWCRDFFFWTQRACTFFHHRLESLFWKSKILAICYWWKTSLLCTGVLINKDLNTFRSRLLWKLSQHKAELQTWLKSIPPSPEIREVPIHIWNRRLFKYSFVFYDFFLKITALKTN